MKKYYTRDELKHLIIMEITNENSPWSRFSKDKKTPELSPMPDDHLPINTTMHPDELEKRGHEHIDQFHKHNKNMEYHNKEHERLFDTMRSFVNSPGYNEKKHKPKIDEFMKKMDFHNHMRDVEARAAETHADAVGHFIIPANYIRWRRGERKDRNGNPLRFDGKESKRDKKFLNASDKDRKRLSRLAWKASSAANAYRDKMMGTKRLK